MIYLSLKIIIFIIILCNVLLFYYCDAQTTTGDNIILKNIRFPDVNSPES